MQKIKARLSMRQIRQGSALIYSLIILAAMLFIVTSISVVSITEKKNASSTDFSVQSFQTANSGFQLGLTKINKSMATDGNETLADIYGVACDTGKVANLTGAGPGDALYTLSFKDEAGVEIADCSTLVNKIASIKSVGTYNNTVRAVEVAVAAPGLDIQIVQGSLSACRGASVATCPAGYKITGGGSYWVASCGCAENERFVVRNYPTSDTEWTSTIECATNRAYAVCGKIN